MFVLHEAIEALGYVSSELNMKQLERLSKDDGGSRILYETCFLTNKLVEWRLVTQNGATENLDLSLQKYNKFDHAPPYNFEAQPKYKDIEFVRSILLDNVNYDLFERYRALYTLRELDTEEAVIAMCQCFKDENFGTCSALLKHEVALVISQMEDKYQPAVPYLLDCLENPKEEPIVRHEVLICLGMTLEDDSKLERFREDPDHVVSESAEAAIHLI